MNQNNFTADDIETIIRQNRSDDPNSSAAHLRPELIRLAAERYSREGVKSVAEVAAKIDAHVKQYPTSVLSDEEIKVTRSTETRQKPKSEILEKMTPEEKLAWCEGARVPRRLTHPPDPKLQKLTAQQRHDLANEEAWQKAQAAKKRQK